MDLVDSCQSGVNDARTCAKIDTPLTQPRSLIVLAQNLLRQRSALLPQRRPLVSNLVQQIYNYDSNPEAMRPRILETVDRLTAMNAED